MEPTKNSQFYGGGQLRRFYCARGCTQSKFSIATPLVLQYTFSIAIHPTSDHMQSPGWQPTLCVA